MLRVRKAFIVAGLMLLGVVGCSGAPEKPKVYAVTGKVTVQGAPLEGALISFVPVGAGDGASATLASGGSYTLMALDGRPGCPPGKYKVVLRPSAEAMQAAMKGMTGPGGPKVDSKVPPTYSDAATSPKEVEVKEQANVIDIAI